MNPRAELRPICASDREPLAAILRALPVFFTPEEVDVALELIDAGLGGESDEGYRFIVAEHEGRVAGYACFGRAVMTDRTFDLYWIATDPELHGRGIGRQILAEVERQLRSEGARLLVVETAGKAAYAPTRAFYAAAGYTESARLPDFYREGDDKVFHTKLL